MGRRGHRAVLRTGDQVRLDGVIHTVTAITGTVVRLTDGHGRTVETGLVDVFTHGVVESRDAGPANRLSGGVLAGLPEPAVTRARWWEGHIVEVICGLAPDAPPKAAPRAHYDPQTTTMAQREAAKAAELTAELAGAGEGGVSARTVRRRRQRYEAMGLPGLLDGRAGRRQPVSTDTRVVDALKRAIEEASDASSRTVSYYGGGSSGSSPRSTATGRWRCRRRRRSTACSTGSPTAGTLPARPAPAGRWPLDRTPRTGCSPRCVPES